MIAHVDVEEVDDVAEAETVQQISDRAAENQMQAALQHAVGDGGAQRVDDHDAEDGDRAAVEEKRDDARVGVRADAEGRAGVAHVHELEEMRNDRNGLVQIDALDDEPLRPEVDANHGGGERQQVKTFQAICLSSIKRSSSSRSFPRISSYVKCPSDCGPRLRFT